jgi:nucleoside-diphosphate-sugar epimerase
MQPNNTVLITGSTGFIGNHLAKRLASKKFRVKGLVKDHFTPAGNIDQLGIEKIYGDMTSLDAMRKATEGCEIVVHCAVGQPRENAIGTKMVVQAATENKVKKFVHLSTTAVYGYWPSADEIKDGRLQKSHSKQNFFNDYCFSKIESEEIAFSYYDSHQLPLVVLRLANVYGPESTYWTTTPIQMIQQECFTLIDGGYTPSNTVYIDNVLDAIESAISNDQAIGQAFIISDEESINWRQFFTEYLKMQRQPCQLKEISRRKLGLYKKKIYVLAKKNLLQKKILNSIKGRIQNMKLPSIKTNIEFPIEQISFANISSGYPSMNNSGFSSKTEMPTETEVALSKLPPLWLEKSLVLPHKFQIDGAHDILGLKSQTSFEEGMKQTAQWLGTRIS